MMLQELPPVFECYLRHNIGMYVCMYVCMYIYIYIDCITYRYLFIYLFIWYVFDSKAVVPRGHVGLQVVLIPRFVRASEFTGKFLE